MSRMTFTERLHVLVAKPMMKALRAEAQRSGESLGDLTRQAIQDFLDMRASHQTPFVSKVKP